MTKDEEREIFLLFAKLSNLLENKHIIQDLKVIYANMPEVFKGSFKIQKALNQILDKKDFEEILQIKTKELGEKHATSIFERDTKRGDNEYYQQSRTFRSQEDSYFTDDYVDREASSQGRKYDEPRSSDYEQSTDDSKLRKYHFYHEASFNTLNTAEILSLKANNKTQLANLTQHEKNILEKSLEQLDEKDRILFDNTLSLLQLNPKQPNNQILNTIKYIEIYKDHEQLSKRIKEKYIQSIALGQSDKLDQDLRSTFIDLAQNDYEDAKEKINTYKKRRR